MPRDNGSLEWIRGHEDEYEAFDNVTGLKLDPTLVAEVRKLEVEYIRRIGVYSRAPRIQAERSGECHPGEVD